MYLSNIPSVIKYIIASLPTNEGYKLKSHTTPQYNTYLLYLLPKLRVVVGNFLIIGYVKMNVTNSFNFGSLDNVTQSFGFFSYNKS